MIVTSAIPITAIPTSRVSAPIPATSTISHGTENTYSQSSRLVSLRIQPTGLSIPFNHGVEGVGPQRLGRRTRPWIGQRPRNRRRQGADIANRHELSERSVAKDLAWTTGTVCCDNGGSQGETLDENRRQPLK